MIVECYRGAGQRPGEAIEVPLLSDEMLLVRGAAEMDAQAHRINVATPSIVPRPGVRLGQIIEYVDPISGRPQRGKVTGISVTVVAGTDDAGPTLDHVLTVEVPTT